MTIKELEQEPCEDTISREDVYNVLERHWLNGTVARRIVNELRESIKSLPSVQPKVKKGHWIDDCGNLKCPYCETRVSDVIVFSPLTKYTNTCWFCPICGADMRETED